MTKKKYPKYKKYIPQLSPEEKAENRVIKLLREMGLVKWAVEKVYTKAC